MTDSFSRPGAVDLAAIKSDILPQSSYVETVSEANLEAIIGKSLKHPVVLEITSAKAPKADELSKSLAELATEAEGRFLLARVNIDESPVIAQALQIQSVPVVIAVIGGQLAPLFQGVQPKSAIAAALNQVYQLAVANGIVGRAEPIPESSATDVEPVADPHLVAAYTAMENGDFAQAVTEYEKVLAQNPADLAAKAGRAQALLLIRTAGIDPDSSSLPDSDDSQGQMVLADIEMVAGRYEAAFARLIDRIAQVSTEDREPLRLRLLELFEILGPADPAVVKARRCLTSVLF